MNLETDTLGSVNMSSTLFSSVCLFVYLFVET